jgi:AraC-like DNA-binding protein
MGKITGTALGEKIRVTNLKSAFYYDVPYDFAYNGERHSGWEFVYVEKGKVRATAENSKYILKSGEMVCHKPMEFHKLEPYQEGTTIIVFCFECNDFSMQFFNNKIISVNQRQKLYLNDIVTYAQKLFLPKSPLGIAKDGGMERNREATTEIEQFIKNTIELLVLSLLSAQSTERRKRVESYKQYSHRRTLTADINEYLTQNLANPITLEDISEKFSYSTSSIKRIFKAEMGCSVMNHLSNLRLTRAKELLRDKGNSIEFIANQTGFANVYYFSNFFKNKVHKSPSEYRKQYSKF